MKKTILILDDEAHITMLVSRYLEKAGYKVVRAHHDEQARAALVDTKNPPDLLITDLEAPEGGRLELITDIRNEAMGMKDRPVIVYSGHCGDLHRRDNDLADIYLEKSGRPGEIVEAVNRLLG